MEQYRSFSNDCCRIFESDIESFEDLFKIGKRLNELCFYKSQVVQQSENSETENGSYKEQFVHFVNAYYKCLNMLKENEFQVTKIKIDPAKFYNGEISGCGSETDVFEFKCSKNDYVFDVIFSDDCDCLPGILGMSDLVHVPSNKKIADYMCDLFCQNTSEFSKEIYLDLLNSNKETVLQKHYGFLYEIKDHLKCEIYDEGNLINNFDNLDFYLEININGEFMRLIPIKSGDHFVLMLVPDFFTIEAMDPSDNIEIEIDNRTHLNWWMLCEKIFQIKVDDDFSLAKLDKMLENYKLSKQ